MKEFSNGPMYERRGDEIIQQSTNYNGATICVIWRSVIVHISITIDLKKPVSFDLNGGQCC